MSACYKERDRISSIPTESASSHNKAVGTYLHGQPVKHCTTVCTFLHRSSSTARIGITEGRPPYKIWTLSAKDSHLVKKICLIFLASSHVSSVCASSSRHSLSEYLSFFANRLRIPMYLVKNGTLLAAFSATSYNTYAMQWLVMSHRHASLSIWLLFETD